MNIAVKSLVVAAVLVIGLPGAPNAAHSQDGALPLAKPLSLADAVPSQEALTLNLLLSAAAATHPSMLAARFEAQATVVDVTAAERQRWPVVSAVLESASNTKDSTSTTRLLRLQQTLWDGGRNSARIADAENLAQIGQIKVDLQRQQLYLQIVAAWQNLLNASERKKIAQKTIDRLKIYQAQMQRRVDAEASSRIDLELADSRLLQTSVELNTSQYSLQVALTRLEQLSGESRLIQRIVLPESPSVPAVQQFSDLLMQTDWQSVASKHLAVSKARAEAQQARTRLQTKESEKWPSLYVRVDQPLKQASNNSSTSMTTYAGISYTPGAGFSNIIEAQALSTRIASQDQLVEAAQREAHETLQTDREEFGNARLRIEALENATRGSVLVLESYQRQFQAGRKTWQDLLNAVRELAQNEYALADARSSLVGAMHRLEIRMGKNPNFS